MATQTVLHALFLPTPLKRALLRAHMSVDPSGAPVPEKSGDNAAKAGTKAVSVEDMFTEVLKPGALYRECSVVTLNVPPLSPSVRDAAEKDGLGSDKKGKKRGDKKSEEDLVIEDDGELGGEALGRTVWEWYESQLKAWEASEKKDASEQTVTEKRST